MYCSEKCRDEIYRKFGDMKTLPVGANKLLIDAYDAFGGREKLIEFLKEIDGKKSLLTVFDFDFSDPNDPQYEEKFVKCFLSNYIMQCSTIGCNHGTLSSNGYGNHKLIDKLCKHFQSVANGCRDEEFNPGVIHGTFNHSCDYNISCIERDNQWIYTVVRPVKAGEQLFRFYEVPNGLGLFNIAKVPLSTRLSNCGSCYYCVNKIEPKDFETKYQNVVADADRKLQTWDRMSSKDFDENLKKNWNFINKHYNERLLADVPEMITTNLTLLQVLILTIPKSCINSLHLFP